MTKYNLRKNFVNTYFLDNNAFKGKIAFKTKETTWVKTMSPCVIPISINSTFHEGIWGFFKMDALISVLKENINGPITILITEKAHLRVDSLKYSNNLNRAFTNNLLEGAKLKKRFKNLFQGCEVKFMFQCEKNSIYSKIYKKIEKLSKTDLNFQNLLIKDAKNTYTNERKKNFSNENLFLNKAIEDLKVQCIHNLILAKQGYQFVFYPGTQNNSVEYINDNFTRLQKLSFIHVFISIEKKTILPLNNLNKEMTAYE